MIIEYIRHTTNQVGLDDLIQADLFVVSIDDSYDQSRSLTENFIEILDASDIHHNGCHDLTIAIALDAVNSQTTGYHLIACSLTEQKNSRHFGMKMYEAENQ